MKILDRLDSEDIVLLAILLFALIALVTIFGVWAFAGTPPLFCPAP